jgi:hypothetical protein
MKFIQVTMPDGSKWRLPAHPVAKSLADHYEGPQNSESESYKREYGGAMNNFGVLKDWAQNNMNWSDVEKVAVEYIPAPKLEADYQEGWVNGKMEVFDV